MPEEPHNEDLAEDLAADDVPKLTAAEREARLRRASVRLRAERERERERKTEHDKSLAEYAERRRAELEQARRDHARRLSNMMRDAISSAKDIFPPQLSTKIKASPKRIDIELPKPFK